MQQRDEKVRWGAFWSLVVIQSMNSLNEKGVQFLLIALGIWMGTALQYPLSVLIVLPFVLFSPLGGWWADRYCRTRLLQQMVLLQVVALTGMCIGLFLHNLSLAVGSFTVFCVQAMFFSPAKKGLVKDMVGTRHIGFASGILEISSMLMLLVGQIAALGTAFACRPTNPRERNPCVGASCGNTSLSYACSGMTACCATVRWALAISGSLPVP